MHMTGTVAAIGIHVAIIVHVMRRRPGLSLHSATPFSQVLWIQVRRPPHEVPDPLLQTKHISNGKLAYRRDLCGSLASVLSGR